MAYGLNPAMGPDVPSRPTTSVPGAGGALDAQVLPVGTIGAGRFGGVHAVTASSAAATTTHPAHRLPHLVLIMKNTPSKRCFEGVFFMINSPGRVSGTGTESWR